MELHDHRIKALYLEVAQNNRFAIYHVRFRNSMLYGVEGFSKTRDKKHPCYGENFISLFL